MPRLIFGCGYLGHRIGRSWLNTGDTVYAVTRNPTRADALADEGFVPIIADITQAKQLESLPEAETVLFAVGMDRSAYDDIRLVYVDGLKHVLERLCDNTKHFIYISSTGVYGDFGGAWVDEDSPTEPAREGGQACVEAEALIRQSRFADRATILRLAGIYGPGRVPTQSTIDSRDWSKLTPEGYLNLIHVDDAADLVQLIAESKPQGQVFNVSDGNPVIRRDYYQLMADLVGASPIPWNQTGGPAARRRSGSNKRVSNRKLQQRFGFEFRFPDYRAGLRQATSAE